MAAAEAVDVLHVIIFRLITLVVVVFGFVFVNIVIRDYVVHLLLVLPVRRQQPKRTPDVGNLLPRPDLPSRSPLGIQYTAMLVRVFYVLPESVT